MFLDLRPRKRERWEGEMQEIWDSHSTTWALPLVSKINILFFSQRIISPVFEKHPNSARIPISKVFRIRPELFKMKNLFSVTAMTFFAFEKRRVIGDPI